MICPVCQTAGQKAEVCAQCGADLEIHRMLQSALQKEVDLPMKPNPEVSRFGGLNLTRGPILFLCSLAVNLMLVAAFVTSALTFPLPGASDSTSASKASVSMADSYFEQIRSLTALLQQALEASADQRRELNELRTELKAARASVPVVEEAKSTSDLGPTETHHGEK